ncbi:hypothetical protein K3495_g14758 [Podosphaera aphanis]|nr:hypothetical protein K3495_g14758 [Podosphaera aphanis]
MDGDDAQRNASEEVFPNTTTLICVWHVNQCVQNNCKGKVDEEDWEELDALWRGIIPAATVEQYTHLWTAFKTKYSNEKTGSCGSYLENGWLKESERERLLQAYTDRHLHFGVRTTSRAEGVHAYIKRYLAGKKSRGSLLTSWLNIGRAVINQLTVVTVRTNVSRDRTPLGLDRRLFQGCIGVVTLHALRLVQQTLNLSSSHLDHAVGLTFDRWVCLVPTLVR